MKKCIFFFFLLSSLLGTIAQNNFDVINYSINLDVNNEAANSHIGYTDIRLRLLDFEDNSIKLMLKGQTVDSVKNCADNTVLDFEYSDPNVRIALPLSSLQDTMTVRVYYHGSEVVENNSMAWGGLHYLPSIIYTLGVAFGDYPHSYARSWFVAKDVFDDKATYDLHIRVKNSVQAICSGVLDSISEDGTSHVYHYTLSENVSPYLVAMTIADFSLYQQTITSSYGRNIPLEVRYTSQYSPNTIENMFSKVPIAFDTLEKSFGKFRFNRVGYCVTPKGSMEHVDNISLAKGALTDEISGMSNIVHELGHSWFGNTVTCKTAEDMWLNEGWTSFTTRLSLSAIYGEKATRDFFRNIHENVLSSVVRQEGYFPISRADSSQTYGSTVYDKGSLIALSLKEYLSDSLFFSSIRSLIDSFEFSNISSEIVRDFFSEKSGKDLTSFFDCMVFSPSTPHYEIAEKNLSDGQSSLTFLQRAYPDNTKTLSSSRLPVTFFDKNFNSFKTYVEFNSNQAQVTFDDIPFTPVEAMLDYDEEFMDLRTASALTVNESNAIIAFPNTYFRMRTKALVDSALVRATLHWIGDSVGDLPYGVEKISSKHYWTIEGINIDSVNMQGLFHYEISTYPNAFDSTLATSYLQMDSILLLYRKDKSASWTLMPTTPITSDNGYMLSDYLLPGDYVMALGNKKTVGLDIKTKKNSIKVYPNPTGKVTKIDVSKDNINAKLFSSNGKILKNWELKRGINLLDLSVYEGNFFIINFFDAENGNYYSKILIKE
ncbi:MAG: hypothetical protein IJ748_04965 [Bacteroidales bacterium]|nr:hypothetical protein [Bacteroidales bacterium]